MFLFMVVSRKIGVSDLDMTPEAFRDCLAQLGFSQQGFAKIVGASPRTGQKWALGESRLPGSVVLLLRLLSARPEMLLLLEAIEQPKIRKRASNIVAATPKRQAKGRK